MGKTSLALNIAENAALGARKSAAVFSMEMSVEQLAFRMVSSLGRVDQAHLRNGRFGDDDWPRINGAIQQMAEAPIYIDDTPSHDAHGGSCARAPPAARAGPGSDRR